MAGSQNLAPIGLFGSKKWIAMMRTFSENETILVLTGVAISLVIRTRTNAVAFIANGALSSSTTKLSRSRYSIPEAAVS